MGRREGVEEREKREENKTSGRSERSGEREVKKRGGKERWEGGKERR